jgi:Na+/H+-dicarboxylate symporter
MAHCANLENKLDIATWVNVGLASSLGSAGAAPVPNAGIVMLITVWETALPGFSVPDSIAYVQGIEFLLDRFRTATNVCSDLMILRIIQVINDKERKLVD